MSYRQKILELAKVLGPDMESEVKKLLNPKASEHELMLQYQAMREVMAEEAGEGDTSFEVMVDGKPKKFKNLKEWNEFVATLPIKHNNVSISSKVQGEPRARRIRRKL